MNEKLEWLRFSCGQKPGGGLNNTQVCWSRCKVHTYFYLYHILSFEGQGHMCKYK